MPFQPCPAWSAVVSGLTEGAKPWVNVFNIAVGSGVAFNQTAVDAIGATLTSAYTHWLPFASANYFVNQCVVTDLRTEGAGQLVSATPAGLVGTGSGDGYAGQVAALIHWVTGFRGREGRGRTYMAGMTEAAMVGDNISSGANTALGSFVTDVIGNGSFCVLSRYKGTEDATSGKARKKPIPRAEGITHVLTGGSPRLKVATQRRRLR